MTVQEAIAIVREYVSGEQIRTPMGRLIALDALAMLEDVALGRRCPECGGPLEGWSGEHHSSGCSIDDAQEKTAMHEATLICALAHYSLHVADPTHVFEAMNAYVPRAIDADWMETVLEFRERMATLKEGAGA